MSSRVTGLPTRLRAAVRLGFDAAPAGFLTLVLLAVTDGACAPALAWTTKLLLDSLFSPPVATGRIAVLVAVTALLGLYAGCRQSVQAYLGQTVGRAIRLVVVRRLFGQVNSYPGLRRFEDPAFRDRLRLAEQVGDHAPAQLLAAGAQAVGRLVQLIGFAAVLVAVWPPIAVLVLLAAVPAAVAHVRLGRVRAQTAEGLSAGVRRQFFYKTLLTDPQAAKEVRLFGLGDYLHARLVHDFRAAKASEDAVSRRTLRASLALDTLGAAVTAAGVAAAAWQALDGRLTIGGVTAFIAAVAGVHAAGLGCATAAADTYEALLLFGSYHDIVDEPMAGTGGGEHPGPLRRGIEFRDVWFRYHDDGPWVLRGLTLHLRPGEAVGLVGRNGAGKSTVVKLLCRMYEPQRGTIHWDGADLADLDPVALRGRISAVFQDFMQYDLTAAENIAVGDLAADRPAIRRAAAEAGVDGDLTALPHGYDTMLSRLFVPDLAPDGTRAEPGAVAMLSGGQWQRVAAARGFLRDGADLLILDEPSSGLDAEAEHALHHRLRTLRAGRTSLLISHRLSALRDADRIIVLRDGTVAESGNHADLLSADGDYARLFRLQAAGYADGVLASAEH